jgi:hypothetical protein
MPAAMRALFFKQLCLCETPSTLFSAVKNQDNIKVYF